MRKPIVRSNNHFYYITGHSFDEKGFYLPRREMTEVLVNRLVSLQLEFDLKITFLLVTENEFHIILMTPNVLLARIMFFFMKDSTRIIQKRTRRINHIYGSRYKCSLIGSIKEHLSVFSYLTSLDPDQSNSSFVRSRLKLIDSEMGLRCMELTDLEGESIRCGLKKTQFSFKKDKSNRPLIPAWYFNTAFPEKSAGSLRF